MIAGIALALALVALVMAGCCMVIIDRLVRDLRDDALEDYWAALTPDQERNATDRIRKYGGRVE